MVARPAILPSEGPAFQPRFRIWVPTLPCPSGSCPIDGTDAVTSNSDIQTTLDIESVMPHLTNVSCRNDRTLESRPQVVQGFWLYRPTSNGFVMRYSRGRNRTTWLPFVTV